MCMLHSHSTLLLQWIVLSDSVNDLEFMAFVLTVLMKSLAVLNVVIKSQTELYWSLFSLRYCLTVSLLFDGSRMRQRMEKKIHCQ